MVSSRFAGVAARDQRTSGYTTSIARSVEEVEALRPLWTRMHRASLQSDIDYFLTVERHHPEAVRPHVIAVHSSAGESSLLAGHLMRRRLDHRLGPWASYRPWVRAISISRGVVGKPTVNELCVALEAIRGELGAGVDVVLLHNLDPGSTLHEAAVTVFPAWSRQRWSPHKVRWDRAVGPVADEVLALRSRSTRQNVRRTQRRIARDFGHRAEMRIYSQPADAETLFRDIDTVAAKTYQTKSRPIFRDNDLERSLVALGLEKGWFRAYLLYLEDLPVAFWTGYSYAGVFGWRGVTGYDPAYRGYGVGKYLLAALLEDLARDPEVTHFSLGPGDIPYKRRFADERRGEVDVRVFSSTQRGIRVNAVGSAINGLNALVRGTRKIRHLGTHVDALNERRKQRERRPRV
jgi:CelD/BcsL family acetyltransferase involved in cellulose biosynthesis